MTAAFPKSPLYKCYNGMLIPYTFSAENLASSLTYKANSDDIFICTYPKCGTTWLQNIVYLIMHNGQPFPADKTVDEIIPFLELKGKEHVEKTPSPRVIKTHRRYDLTPMNQDAKYIYVARNPKDCVVSFYYHTCGFVMYDFENGDFDHYFDLFMEGKVDSDDYFDHLLSWLPHLDDANVLFLTFEDLKKDTRSGIVKVAEFLGGECAKVAENAEIIDKILLHSDFKSMKKNEGRWYPKRAESAPAFLRKGAVGDWRNTLSESQSKRMDKRFTEKNERNSL